MFWNSATSKATPASSRSSRMAAASGVSPASSKHLGMSHLAVLVTWHSSSSRRRLTIRVPQDRGRLMDFLGGDNAGIVEHMRGRAAGVLAAVMLLSAAGFGGTIILFQEQIWKRIQQRNPR